MRDRDRTRDHHDEAPSDAAGTPGKVSRAGALQRKAAARSAMPPPAAAAPMPMSSAEIWAAIDDPFGLHLSSPALQRRAAAGAEPDVDLHGTAAQGVAGPAVALPHADAIQGAFGPDHDVSSIRAHVGGEAAVAARAIGAEAYATGPDVAFSRAPDLHTAAHEAAHVIQQRGGVQLAGGVGQEGDPYERHADAVADRVVRGESAADLLTGGGDGGGGRAVQRTVPEDAGTGESAPASPASPAAAGPTITPPSAGIDQVGFIDHGDGSNIRTGPAETGGATVRDEPLPPATRVFVSGTHPSAPDWWYVTATLADRSMVRGYVQRFRVNTDLPEPTARLYQIVAGDTPRAIAAREFSGAVRDGHDLRYYENVLLYVNQQAGRAGITGSYQDPRLLGGGDNNIQLEAGRRIWLVSPAYAQALESVVPDGSLTGGAVASVRRFAGHLEDILASVTESPSHMVEVAGEYAQAIRDHLPEIVGIVAAFIAAEALSAFLAATPTGVGQIAAIVIQLGLAAFGAYGMVEAGVAALQHASRWLETAWTANGAPDRIAAASVEFLRMLVSIAMAALAYLGVRGNMSRAVTIANNLPPAGMMPAMAVAGGGTMRGPVGGAVPGVALGPPGPFGPLGTAMAMNGDETEGPGGGDRTREERLEELARDPDHGGAITPGSRAEAEAALGLEEAGQLPRPVRRPVPGDGHSGDFIDGANVDWDVKAPQSRDSLIARIRRAAADAGRPAPEFPAGRPIRGEFNLADVMREIRGELAARENVIVDTRGLNAADAATLRQGITDAGLNANVKFYPP
jgi:hypothetical protein